MQVEARTNAVASVVDAVDDVDGKYILRKTFLTFSRRQEDDYHFRFPGQFRWSQSLVTTFDVEVITRLVNVVIPAWF